MHERCGPSTGRPGAGPAWVLAMLLPVAPALANPGAAARTAAQELVTRIGTRHATCGPELLGETAPARIDPGPSSARVALEFTEVFEALPDVLGPLAARADMDLDQGILSVSAEPRVHDCQAVTPTGSYARARCSLLFEVKPDATGSGLWLGVLEAVLPVLTSSPDRFSPRPRPPVPGADAAPPPAPDPATLRPLLLDLRIDAERRVALQLQVREELDALESLVASLAHGPEVALHDLWLRSVERATSLRRPVRDVSLEALAKAPGPGKSPATVKLLAVLRELATRFPEARLDTLKCEAPARTDGVVVLPTNLVFSGPRAALDALQPAIVALDPAAQVQRLQGEAGVDLLEALFELAPDGRPAPPPPGPGPKTPDVRKILVSTLGAPFAAKGTNPKAGFSAMGLIRYALAHQGLRDVPRTVDALRADPRVTRLPARDYRPRLGDVVFFKVPVGDAHVLYPALILDPERKIFVIASRKKGRVVRQKLDQEPFVDLFDSALRLAAPSPPAR